MAEVIVKKEKAGSGVFSRKFILVSIIIAAGLALTFLLFSKEQYGLAVGIFGTMATLVSVYIGGNVWQDAIFVKNGVKAPNEDHV